MQSKRHIVAFESQLEVTSWEKILSPLVLPALDIRQFISHGRCPGHAVDLVVVVHCVDVQLVVARVPPIAIAAATADLVWVASALGTVN